MIELRWILRPGWDGSERILQYRQTIDVSVRAGTWHTASMANSANIQWSEWCDVPEIFERMKPNTPEWRAWMLNTYYE